MKALASELGTVQLPFGDPVVPMLHAGVGWTMRLDSQAHAGRKQRHKFFKHAQNLSFEHMGDGNMMRTSFERRLSAEVSQITTSQLQAFSLIPA